MKFKLLLLLLLLLLFALKASVLSAQQFDIQNVYPIETNHSFFEFEVTYFGYAKVKGSFSDFYGSIYYDTEDPQKTSVTFQIDVNSIDTNNDWRDSDLKSKNWFLTEEFPYINFTSERVEQSKNGLKVTGQLTVKETTKTITLVLNRPIVVPKDIRGDRQVIFTGSYVLNRKEYGVMGKNWSEVKEGIAALSDSVMVEFSLLGKQIKEENFENFLRRESSPHGSMYAAYKADGIEAAKNRADQLKESEELSAGALNMVVYMLLQQNKDKDALALIKYSEKSFPNTADVYDMMGEVYANMGKLNEAKKCYLKTVELDPQNTNAIEILKHLSK